MAEVNFHLWHQSTHMPKEIVVIDTGELKKLIQEVFVEVISDLDLSNRANPAAPVPVKEKLISLREVQAIIGCSLPKLFMLRKAKRFPSEIRIGKSVFFDRLKFFDFLDNGGTKAGIIS